MSRRSNRNRNTVTLDRRDLERVVEAAIARKFTPPQGANVTPISQAVIDQMYASMAPQDKTQGYFSPGAPIRPVEGITPKQGPRQFQYPIGYNIGRLPRSTEMTSFDTLRNLAMLYDGIGLCEQVWFDLCSKPELVIKPRDELMQDDNGDPIPPSELHAKYGDRIAKWKAFFAKPDKRRSLKQWMRMALKEKLEIDALSIFKHKDRSGGLYALEILDGSTIKPLLDERGMAPYPPYPAYQQFVYGVPGMLILGPDLIYRREIERTESPYGLSRVERIILRVNQALRKQNKDLATFTDGNVPNSTLEPPDDGTTDWTPEQLLMYQEMWDGVLAGNDSIRSRVKVIPPGSKLNKLDPDDIMTPFDMFLLNVTVGMFGLTMSELGFTENVNKSSGDTQEAVIYRRAMAPMMDDTSEIFTDVMVEEGETELEATWKAFEEPEDLKTKAEAWNILVGNGTQSTSQAAHAMGLKPMFETEPFVITKEGPVFIKDVMDLRDATMKAKQAGLQMSIDNPGGMNEQGTQPGPQGAQAGKNGANGTGGGAAKASGGAASQSQGNGRTNAASTASRSLEPVVPGQSSDAGAEGERQLHDERAIKAELRRWRDIAVKLVEQGKPATSRQFVSDIIGERERENVTDMLSRCKTVDEVRSMFAAIRVNEHLQELMDFRARQAAQDAEIIGAEPRLEYNAALDIWEAADTEDQLAALRAQGDTIEWDAHTSASGACPVCAPNDGLRRTIGEQFPSGHRIPQVHGNCQCSVTVVSSLGAVTGGGAM